MEGEKDLLPFLILGAALLVEETPIKRKRVTWTLDFPFTFQTEPLSDEKVGKSAFPTVKIKSNGAILSG
ncbi:hypothetical protein FRC18_010194 [Serendipita sp. 400]|nr:hypothetical protein FRC18_010194 [Serendipita sp. 400]